MTNQPSVGVKYGDFNHILTPVKIRTIQNCCNKEKYLDVTFAIISWTNMTVIIFGKQDYGKMV